MRSVRGVLLVVGLVVLGACGGGGDTYGAVDEVPDDAVVVTVADLAFDPAEVEIETSDRVAWLFDDGVIPHNVRFADEDIGSETLRDGEVWARRFTSTGTYEYLCTIHPAMRGTVTVR